MTPHSFGGSWEPGSRRGDDEVYVASCACGLSVEDPSDSHVIDHCPPVEALSPEWLRLHGLPATCEEQLVLSVLEC